MGLLRIILALAVVAGHANGDILGIPALNRFYAVQAFFIISGFYMAMVLNEGYQGSKGLRNFYGTRALRIFPMYFIGVTIACALNLLGNGTPFTPEFWQLNLGSKLFYLASNLIILGQELPYLFCFPKQDGSCASEYLQLVIPAWSIAAELMFYVLAPFLVRSNKRLACFVGAGAVFLAAMAQLTYPQPAHGILRPAETLTYQYFAFPATWLFFGLGALGYRIAMRKLEPSPWFFVALAVLMLILWHTGTIMPWWHAMLFAAAVPLLFGFTRTLRWDRWIGELSYPVYILHYPVFRVVNILLPQNPEQHANATALLTILAAITMLLLIDRPVERLRHRLFPAKPKTS